MMNKLTPADESRKLAFGVEPSRRRYRLRLARYKALAEEVAVFVKGRKLKEDEKLTLLDVGVGGGRSLRYIDNEGVSGHISFFGVDNSVERLTNVYCLQRWTLKQCDIEQNGLAFDANTFDIVICEQVLEHLDNPAAVMREIVRVLRPGGLLIVGTATYWPGFRYVRKYVVSIFDRIAGRKRGHKQFYSCRSFTGLIKQTNRFAISKVRGFRIVSGGPISWLENFHWWYKFNRFLGRILPRLCPDIQIIAVRDAQAALP